jgi:hypothetical protein
MIFKISKVYGIIKISERVLMGGVVPHMFNSLIAPEITFSYDISFEIDNDFQKNYRILQGM